MSISVKIIVLGTDFSKSFYRSITEDLSELKICLNTAVDRDLIGFEMFWIDKDNDEILIKSEKDWSGCVEVARRQNEMKIYVVDPELLYQFSRKALVSLYKHDKAAFSLASVEKPVESPVEPANIKVSKAREYYSSTMTLHYVDKNAINSSVSEASFYSAATTTEAAANFIEAGSALVQLASDLSDTMKSLSDLTLCAELKEKQKHTLVNRPMTRSVPVNYSDADLKAILHTQAKQLNTRVMDYLSPKVKRKCYSGYEEVQAQFTEKWSASNSINLASSVSLSSTDF